MCSFCYSLRMFTINYVTRYTFFFCNKGLVVMFTTTFFPMQVIEIKNKVDCKAKFGINERKSKSVIKWKGCVINGDNWLRINCNNLILKATLTTFYINWEGKRLISQSAIYLQMLINLMIHIEICDYYNIHWLNIWIEKSTFHFHSFSKKCPVSLLKLSIFGRDKWATNVQITKQHQQF